MINHKRTVTKWMLLAALPALLLAACSKEHVGVITPGPATAGGDIKFDIGFAPQTRVTTDAVFKSTWEDGDEIGIFAVRRAPGETATLAASGNYIHNVKMTYNIVNGGSWSLDQGVELWWPGSGDVLDFYAYHPYDDNGGDPAGLDPTNITFNVAADQGAKTGGRSNYNLSDLLTAKADNAAKGSTVTLTFAHAMAMVQVTLTADRAKNIGPVGNNIGVVLQGVKTGAALDLATGVSASGGAGRVKMYRSGETDKGEPVFRALVPAQTFEAGYRLHLSQFNEQYYYIPATGQELTAAKAQIHPVEMPFIPTAKIKAGTFLMGSSDGSNYPIYTNGDSDLNTTPEHPDRDYRETQHKVTLTKDFYMGKYEVTNTQYAAFLNATGVGKRAVGEVTYEVDGTQVTRQQIFISPNEMSIMYDGTKWVSQEGYENHPVVSVSWYGAKAFVNWIGGNLPTEAQWEYACRAGTETAYNYGDTENGNYIWYSENNAPSGPDHGTQPIGRKGANRWGLYDMHGNVYECCLDQWNSFWPYGSEAVVDPVTEAGTERIVRGGSWLAKGKNCRSSHRHYFNPFASSLQIGFRIVIPAP